MYDLLVKGGTVVDPAQGINGTMDIGITAGKVTHLDTKINPTEAKKVIHAGGKIVTPGLIDIHTHVAGGIIDIATEPDHAGVCSGVTTVCDQGSTGWANFSGFRRFVVSRAQTDVFCFLHVTPVGLAVLRVETSGNQAFPELWDWRQVKTEVILKTIKENRDVIKGIKIRAMSPVMRNLGIAAMETAKKVAVEAGLPLMIHLGIDLNDETSAEEMTHFTRQMLPLLDKGDILTHVYTWKVGGVIRSDGSMLPEFAEARERGVLLDIAQGMSHWSWGIAKRAVERGILPTTISTDLIYTSLKAPGYSMITSMSRFLALGLTLEQIVAMATINPARILREEGKRGSLQKGMPADISILELIQGDFAFPDGFEGGKTVHGNSLLKPWLTLKNGVEIAPKLEFQ